ncbi:MAG: hypothetical protein RLZZ230_539 [Candidatus Parcubacteria bacterium]|jgi:hypothetical protein
MLALKHLYFEGLRNFKIDLLYLFKYDNFPTHLLLMWT